jgi:hypothetical protein
MRRGCPGCAGLAPEVIPATNVSAKLSFAFAAIDKGGSSGRFMAIGRMYQTNRVIVGGGLARLTVRLWSGGRILWA